MPNLATGERDRSIDDAFDSACAIPEESETTDVQHSTAQACDESGRRDAITLDFLITVIGFGLCRAWIIFCLGAPLIAGSSSSRTWLYLVFGALSALIVSFAASRKKQRENALHIVLFRFAPIALFASGALISTALWNGSEALLAIGFILGGLGAGPLQVLWGERFAQHSTHFAALASPAAAIITALVAASSTDHTSFIGFAVMPLLSFALLLFEAHRTGLSLNELTLGSRNAAVKTAPTTSQGFATPVHEHPASAQGSMAKASDDEKAAVGLGVGKLMFSIMTFSFLCRLFDATPVQDDPFAFLGGSAMFSLIVVGTAFLAIVARLKDRFNPTFTYRLSLPIMVAGFVAIALLFDTHAAISILLINVGYEFFDILTWVLFADVARRRDGNALRVFGLGVAFTFAGMALGTKAGSIIDSLVASGDVQITVVAMMATLCLVVVAFMVFPEGALAQLSSSMRIGRKDRDSDQDLSNPSSEAEIPGEDPEAHGGRIEQHCASVSKAYGLTPRESEVIVLLAYGRTLSIIARDLHIAKGTARTHIENIYRKLDVHKQQELIDLVENCES